ncbi:SPOR domain-containing protein [Pseudomonas edaphica]|jgi:DedD protein|uniref:SPOR domain-containing protein n=2 Tax=Pseudomonas edaphica TaxID=2006980 RepID=A0A5R8QV70_9PSED|nr:MULTISPECIES: SPOR domain-containing protein [Pseudomonas]MCF5231295.1 SPOR domain-containing protein [Pseudomonas sp. PA-5-4H]MCF5235797.1 SPOR domain-containing protein [Pseudomonas sp. PA-5-4G]MCF5248840.1 SPOR domain-containing protein [Pseudomonas sp. PA-5-4B]MCF5253832.1 SPOR domain-containing protein [Pseudomonas sp. PA-5-4B]MCF5258496.1 SPOR domain-containing protein [Pseudomonas sp. PA-5-4A]
MALLDSAYKQRMVGALVLVALAVIFLPMLFSRQDEQRQVVVEAPAAPQAPAMPQVQVEPVVVPEPQTLPEEPVPSDDEVAAQTTPAAPAVPVQQSVPVVKPAPAPAAPVVAAKPAAPAPAPKPVAPQPAAPGKPDVGQSRIDPNGLPISWSIQLASLANRESADALQKKLRAQGYNAYIRSADGKNRVFIGPLIERAEADRLRDLLGRQQNLNGFVVRFQPERG